MERQLQDAVGGRITNLATRLRAAEAVMAGATCPHREMANPVGRVWRARSIKRGEALVDVVVPNQNKIGASRVQIIHERLQIGQVCRA